MLQPDEIFSFDEDEDPAELLRALPEIRHNLSPAPREEELGLRALLDWREQSPPVRTYDAA